MIVHPLIGIDDLRLGTPRRRVRGALGGDYDSFRKSKGENLTDAYDELGLHLYFDDEDQLEFIEVFEPASLSCQGIELLDRDMQEVQQEFHSRGIDFVETDVGLRSDSLGIALTAPDGTIEGVGVFGPGYYTKARKKRRK